MAETVHVFEIRWGHGKYRPPPDGMPEVLARLCVKVPKGTGGKIPEEMERLWYAHKPPRGYSICFSSARSSEKRALSQDGRAKVRRGNLKRRLEEKVPLFAEELERRELDSQPEYFSGARPNEQEQAIREDAERRRADWEAATAGIGLVILYRWWQEDSNAA